MVKREKKKSLPRIPQQARGLETKNRILKAAEYLFSKRGFYKTNSIAIARRAKVAVGSFYAYFKNKKAVLIESLKRHNVRIMESLNHFHKKIQQNDMEITSLIRELVENIYISHKELPAYHHEVPILIIQNPEIGRVMKQFEGMALKKTIDIFNFYKDRIRVKDIEAAAILITRVIEDIVHALQFGEELMDKDRLLDELTDMIRSYLIKNP
jgi:AcrR family transcriptional regulator